MTTIMQDIIIRATEKLFPPQGRMPEGDIWDIRASRLLIGGRREGSR